MNLTDNTNNLRMNYENNDEFSNCDMDILKNLDKKDNKKENKNDLSVNNMSNNN